MLLREWIIPFALPTNQPLNHIKDYYGEKISLYFAWLGHYTHWLAFPACVGIGVGVQSFVEGTVDSQLVPFFGVFMACWCTCYLEYWKRYNATLSMEWGMNGYEAEETTRPEFQGTEIASPVNGKSMLWFDPAKRLRRTICSFVFIMFMVILVIGAVCSIFVFRYFSKPGSVLGPYFTLGSGSDAVNLSSYIASMVNAIEILVMNTIYKRIAVRLNDYGMWLCVCSLFWVY